MKKTHTSVFLFLGHVRETVSRHVSCRAPLRHIWAGTHGQRPHPQGRLRTTPSAASGVVLPHYGYGAVPPRPCRGPAASRRCGSPFFLKYILHATSKLTSSLAAGWVFSRGDAGSLQGTHFVLALHFIVFHHIRGCLVGSRRR